MYCWMDFPSRIKVYAPCSGQATINAATSIIMWCFLLYSMKVTHTHTYIYTAASLQSYFWPEPLGASNGASDWDTHTHTIYSIPPKTGDFQKPLSDIHKGEPTPRWWGTSVIHCLALFIISSLKNYTVWLNISLLETYREPDSQVPSPGLQQGQHPHSVLF